MTVVSVNLDHVKAGQDRETCLNTVHKAGLRINHRQHTLTLRAGKTVGIPVWSAVDYLCRVHKFKFVKEN